MSNWKRYPNIAKQLSAKELSSQLKLITSADNMHEINGLGDGMLHPICLRIEKLLYEGSKSLISMIVPDMH